MRLVALTLFALLALPAVAVAGGPATVRLTDCTTAAAREQRHATFEGDMHAVRGAMRMQMRFTLQARADHLARWTRVAGSKLDTWRTADPGKARYVYDKRVDNLFAPAQYRVRVRFRWIDASGDVVASTVRVSPTCRQPDPRPDLRIAGFSAQPGTTADSRRYAVIVRNTGRGAAGAFAASLTLPGATPIIQQADALAPHDHTTIYFDAPACAPGSQLQLVVDADEQVDEAFESDNTMAVPCPEGR